MRPLPHVLAFAATGPASPTPAPGGRLGRYLLDPNGAAHALVRAILGAVTAWGPVVGPAGAAVAGLALWGRWWGRRRLRRQLLTDARLITVLPPPASDPAGAAALWANLVGLLRPAWRRHMTGQPHLAWEYVFNRETIRIRVWVPGVIPPGMVERAIEAAWPGARTRVTPAPTTSGTAPRTPLETTVPYGRPPGSSGVLSCRPRLDRLV